MENLFLKSNDGLARRLRHVLHMEDYNNEELGEIKCKYNGVLAEMLITEAVYKLEEGSREMHEDLSFMTERFHTVSTQTSWDGEKQGIEGDE